MKVGFYFRLHLLDLLVRQLVQVKTVDAPILAWLQEMQPELDEGAMEVMRVQHHERSGYGLALESFVATSHGSPS